MEAFEKRQASRIKRRAREAERNLFELIDTVGVDAWPAHGGMDWEQVIRLIESVKIELGLMFDLASNAQREISDRGAP